MAPGEAFAIARPEVLAPDRGALMRRARILSWIGLVWIGLEGAVAVAAGLAAGSVALIGFGADSVIEGLASFVIIWRFTGARKYSERAEGRAQRLVAAQFFVLAPWVAYGAISALLGGHHAETSWV